MSEHLNPYREWRIRERVQRLRHQDFIAADAALVERMRLVLSRETTPEDTFAALEQFSAPMIDEVLTRAGGIEAKAISVLGWTTALLGFLLLEQKQQSSQPQPGGWLLTVALVASLVALLSAAESARARRWKWPSVRHWFCEQAFLDPPVLRAFHLVTLLETYQRHRRTNAHKALYLQISQAAVLLAAMCVAAALWLRVP